MLFLNQLKIGQFILDYCHSIGQKCRIISAQPNDLIAFYAYVRVFKMRHGPVDEHTIGYHIFNEK